MRQNKRLLQLCLILVITVLGVDGIYAQTKNEIPPRAGYLIYTYTVVGSDQSGNATKIPAEISNTVNELKGSYAYSNYRMLSTHFQWIGIGGNVNYQSILKNLSSFQNNENPIYANWNYNSFREDTNSTGSSFIGFRNFNFRLNFPMKNITVTDKEGNKTPSVKYSDVSVSLSNVRVPAEKPAVFASMPVELTNETVFFVIRVKRVE